METIYKTFYSHAPRGARHMGYRNYKGGKIFLLTRPSQGATNEYGGSLIPEDISTHTPLAGRDRYI